MKSDTFLHNKEILFYVRNKLTGNSGIESDTEGQKGHSYVFELRVVEHSSHMITIAFVHFNTICYIFKEYPSQL